MTKIKGIKGEIISVDQPVWEYRINPDNSVEVTELRATLATVNGNHVVATLLDLEGNLHRRMTVYDNLFVLDSRHRVLYFENNDASNLEKIRMLAIKRADAMEKKAAELRRYAAELHIK